MGPLTLYLRKFHGNDLESVPNHNSAYFEIDNLMAYTNNGGSLDDLQCPLAIDVIGSRMTVFLTFSYSDMVGRAVMLMSLYLRDQLFLVHGASHTEHHHERYLGNNYSVLRRLAI